MPREEYSPPSNSQNYSHADTNLSSSGDRQSASGAKTSSGRAVTSRTRCTFVGRHPEHVGCDVPFADRSTSSSASKSHSPSYFSRHASASCGQRVAVPVTRSADPSTTTSSPSFHDVDAGGHRDGGVVLEIVGLLLVGSGAEHERRLFWLSTQTPTSGVTCGRPSPTDGGRASTARRRPARSLTVAPVDRLHRLRRNACRALPLIVIPIPDRR